MRCGLFHDLCTINAAEMSCNIRYYINLYGCQDLYAGSAFRKEALPRRALSCTAILTFVNYIPNPS